MAFVGPSESGKTELIFKLWKIQNFLFQTWKIVIIYKDIQPKVREELNARRVQIEFVKKDEIDRLRNIANLLLVVDDCVC